jgi:TRAP-type C4-dicarboxylate transport system permease small subunit
VSEQPEAPAPTASNDPAWVRALLRVDRALGVGERVLVGLFLATLIGVGAYQAVGRNFFQHSPGWSFELLRYLVFFIALTGGALAAQGRQIINMDVLTRVLSPRGRAIANLATGAFTVAACVFLAYAGWRLRQGALLEERGELIRPATGVLALPIAALLMAFHVLVQNLQLAAMLARGEPPAPPQQAVH